MARIILLLSTLAASSSLACAAVASQAYKWANVKIGGGGGFVPNIVFNPSQKGLAYARTDIGGAYKLNSDDSWTPLLDFADNTHWNYWGVDAIATDPVDPNRLYLVSVLEGFLHVIFSLKLPTGHGGKLYSITAASHS